MHLALDDFLRRIRRRFPAAIRDRGMWESWHDRLIAGHHLSPRRRRALEETLKRGQTAADFYDFASQVFPSHQIRTEIVRFLEHVRERKPRTVLEIGMAQGGTHFLLGAALPDVTLELGVDLLVQNRRLLEAFMRPECRQLFFTGSSYAASTVAQVRAALGDRKIDLLFIDGDHSYAGVKADYEAYAPLVSEGGLIALHDIVPDYQTRFGRTTAAWVGEVPRFWQDVRGEFAETWEFVENPEQDGLGIGLGRKK